MPPPILHQNQPNPFNPTTTISFTLQAAGRVELKICDINGRGLRTLVDAEHNRGDFSVVWDSRDDKGQALGSGLYLARLQLDQTVLARKMILLK